MSDRGALSNGETDTAKLMLSAPDGRDCAKKVCTFLLLKDGTKERITYSEYVDPVKTALNTSKQRQRSATERLAGIVDEEVQTGIESVPTDSNAGDVRATAIG